MSRHRNIRRLSLSHSISSASSSNDEDEEIEDLIAQVNQITQWMYSDENVRTAAYASRNVQQCMQILEEQANEATTDEQQGNGTQIQPQATSSKPEYTMKTKRNTSKENLSRNHNANKSNASLQPSKSNQSLPLSRSREELSKAGSAIFSDLNKSKTATPKAKLPPKHLKTLSDPLKLYEEKRTNEDKEISVVVIGHVDAGKSTLQSNLIDIGKSSLPLAHNLDTSEAEREHGVTIDIAQNNVQLKTRNVTLLDAPGHTDFIPAMITAAARADAAVFVVEAGSQNYAKEHAQLIRALGVSRIIVCVNKLDVFQWDQDKYEETKALIHPFLTKVVKFAEDKISYIPISGLKGTNIKQIDGPAWYTGKCLTGLLEDIPLPNRDLTGTLRLYVSDTFKGGNMSASVSVVGRITRGSIQIGQAIQVLPGKHYGHVKSLERADESEECAFAGETVMASFTGIEPNQITSSSMILDVDEALEPSNSFDAEIYSFDTLTNGYTCVFHANGYSDQAKIVSIEGSRLIKKGAKGKTSIRTSNSIIAERFTDCKESGRFLLRSRGTTVAAGIITKMQPMDLGFFAATKFKVGNFITES